LLALGFIAARLTSPGAAGSLNLAGLTPDVISSVRSVQPAHDGSQPGEVQIVLDETRRRVISGQLDDSNIQRLMLAAAHDENNPGVRWESVDLLRSHSDSSPIRELLLNRVVEDPNAGVRLKALDGLSGFVRQDPQVRDGVLRALISDTNSGVRMQALRLVEPMKTDSNVRSVLTRLSQTDQNPSIRSQARTMLAQMPEMD